MYDQGVDNEDRSSVEECAHYGAHKRLRQIHGYGRVLEAACNGEGEKTVGEEAVSRQKSGRLKRRRKWI